jgi:mono/diheme cytochrome c family protein
MRTLLIATAIAGLAATTAALAGPAPVAPPPALYTQQCASCHGAQLEGGAGPALKSKLIAAEQPGDIYKVIKSGMPITAPGSLTDAQAKLLADYIVAQNKR